MQLVVHKVICIIVILTCIEVIKATTGLNATAVSSPDLELWFQFSVTTDVMKSPNPPFITSSPRTSKSSTYLLTWTSPTNLKDIQFYVIRYRKKLTSDWKYKTKPATSSSVKLNDLESLSLYEVEVVQVLENKGVSRPAVSSFRTGRAKSSPVNKQRFNSTFSHPDFHLHSPTNKKPKKPNAKSSNNTAKVPGAPSKPTVIDTSSTSVSLTWRLGSNGGSPITGYKIQTRKGGSRKKPWRTRHGVISADTRTYDITGLERGTSYKFRVIAINSVGESQPSQSTDPHRTDYRRNLVTAPEITNIHLMPNGSLHIQWKYEGVPPSLFNGFIIKFNIDKKRRRIRIRNSSATSCQIPSPIHDVQYTIKIQAYNTDDKSPKSQPIKFKIIRDHAKKVDSIHFINVPDSNSIRTEEPYEDEDGYPISSPSAPIHNGDAKALVSQRDLAILIAGSVVVVVVFILAGTAVVYHRRASQAKQSAKKGAVQSKTSKTMSLCAKLDTFCCNSASEDTDSCQQISSTPPHCSCCSGNSSPARIGGSCLQSNRTSMSHSVSPDNGSMQCARVPNNPMYTVYYDYRTGRPPPCCSPPGIPLWWVRGADGEFCHIIPHDAKSRVKPIEEGTERNMESRREESDAADAATTSTMVTRSYQGNSSDRNGSDDHQSNSIPDADAGSVSGSDTCSDIDNKNNSDPPEDASSSSDADDS